MVAAFPQETINGVYLCMKLREKLTHSLGGEVLVGYTMSWEIRHL